MRWGGRRSKLRIETAVPRNPASTSSVHFRPGPTDGIAAHLVSARNGEKYVCFLLEERIG